MGIVHFLNVKNGDSSIIEHATGHVSIIDVCNAYEESPLMFALDEALAELAKADGLRGNFDQKNHPVDVTP